MSGIGDILEPTNFSIYPTDHCESMLIDICDDYWSLDKTVARQEKSDPIAGLGRCG